MDKLKNTILIASLVLVGLTIPVRAEMATMDEALTVAKNWVTMIIHHEGDWGGSKSAVVEAIQEFKRGNRVVGYFCRVKPKGYIVVSLRKELAPVKAYSATGYLDPESEEGMADMLKSDMERPLNAIEKELGPIKSARTEDVQRILKVNQRSAWEELEPDVQTFEAGLESGAIAMEYDPGTWLLTMSWHQAPPYNDQCPDMSCSWAHYGNYNSNALVGCGATAAAQIMRYWSWPPGYDWLNMPDKYIYDAAYSPPFKDGNGNPVTQAQIDAVATLCYDAGRFAGMNYTCDASAVRLQPISAAMRTNFVYNALDDDGWDNSIDSWFTLMKGEIDNERPLLYGNFDERHFYVVDGWKYADKEQLWVLWHINYVHGKDCNTPDGCNTWYSRDYLPILDALVKNIKPSGSLGKVLYGTSFPAPSFPYRYFDQDCTNYYYPTAAFAAGQNLQFLPGVKVECRYVSPESKIRFEGTSSENTRLFSIKGTQSAGIKIYNGAIELYLGGGLRFLSRQVVTD